MKLQSSTRRFLDTASVLVLSTAAFLASSGTPVSAQATNGIYAGGSTLASEAFRQIFDCYTGATVGGDNFTFSSGFNPATPTPGLLPTTCTVTSTVQGMYAGVGSGNGVRGYISNTPDQWYGGTLVTTATDQLIGTPFPSGQPPFVDSSNSTHFGSYPYPRVDIGLSDAPLAATTTLTTVSFSLNPATNWASGGVTTSTTQITLQSTTQVATYNTTSWGNPVQLPAFEVPVAIPMNVNSSSFVINSQIKNSSGNIVQGGAIQLTEGQLCAIFSGLVTNWDDATTVIPELDSSGNQLTVGGTSVTFNHANVGNGQSTPPAYANTSLPITVTYRSDGSGTSFILTNYLANVCPLLDKSGSALYSQIFTSGPKHLPSTNFSDLIADIVAARGNGPWNTPTTSTAPHWIGATGSGGVQAAVGVTATQAGNIGYLSNDFVKPYAVNTQAPFAASLQDEAQRIAGTYIPTTTTTTSPSFIVPTPANANTAWGDPALTVPPTTTSTTQTYFENWNVYGINFAATETSTAHGMVSVAGHSVLPLTNRTAAYPLAGTTFLMLYSCYGNATNGGDVITLLNWYYQNTTPKDAKVAQILENNGFAPLNTTWIGRLQNVYLKTGSSFEIATIGGSSTNGCTGVTGGANP